MVMFKKVIKSRNSISDGNERKASSQNKGGFCFLEMLKLKFKKKTRFINVAVKVWTRRSNAVGQRKVPVISRIWPGMVV